MVASNPVARQDTIKHSPLRNRMSKFKMILPVGKDKAWELITTPKGVSSWLTDQCVGPFSQGSELMFLWQEGRLEKLRVLTMGERHSSLQLRRENGDTVRFYLHGRLTTLTLEVQYSRRSGWRIDRSGEIPIWVFYLVNLKSVALTGVDLRSRLKGRSRDKGFVDAG